MAPRRGAIHNTLLSGGLRFAATTGYFLLTLRVMPEDVGKIADRAGVNTLVLSHFVPDDDPSITDEQWADGVRKYFKGRVIVGQDLMEI